MDLFIIYALIALAAIAQALRNIMEWRSYYQTYETPKLIDAMHSENRGIGEGFISTFLLLFILMPILIAGSLFFMAKEGDPAAGICLSGFVLMILFLAWVVKSHLDKQKKVFADETKKSANKILVMMGINLIYVLASLANGLLFPSVPLTTSSIFSITIGPVAIYMFGTVFLYAGLTMAAAVLTSQMIEFFSVEAYKKHQSFILSPEGKKWFSDNYKSKLSPMEFKHYVWLYDFRGIVTFYLATGFMPFAYMIFTTSGASAGPLCILGFLCPALAAWLYVLSLGSKNVDYKPEEGSAPSIE